ncbi:MAG: hypothetical protein ABS913_05400 [Desemzia incerta]|uniref:hypothetical protein n=1 Tax=Desemzia incerta TaxID=82801 RepID=UPI003315AB91
MIKNYTFNLNLGSLWLTIFLLVPTVVWSFFPAPNDILRTESVTSIFDLAASISQVIFIGLLCFKANTAAPKHNAKSTLMISTILSCSVYYLSWIVYYIGMVNFALILILTLAPCAAFLFYTLEKRNHIALFPIGIFTLCHLIYAIINFS